MHQTEFWRNSCSQLRIDRTEAVCIQMDELAQNDFTYRLSSEEYERFWKTWSIFLNTSGRNAPMKLRSDFSEALTKMHRLHRESVEERLAPIPFWQYQKWHSSSSSTKAQAVERSLVELTNHQIQAPLSSWNERHHRTERPVVRLLHKAAQKWHFDKIFWNLF